jgi:N-acetyl-anhydromuramyl-L-alanine amidase AmpD
MFLQAKNYTKVDHRKIDLIVMHDMEAPEKPTTAEGVAQFFHEGKVQASAHFCCDNNSIVQCVHDHDVAWAAPGANHNGLHYELSGYAAQGRKSWLDKYGKEMLELVAKSCARKCQKYGIPIRHISPHDIKAGKKGFVGHRDVTAAYPNMGTHSDPGQHFPWDYFLERVRYWNRRI